MDKETFSNYSNNNEITGNDTPSVDKVLQASCQKAFAAGKTTFISKILEQMLLKCSTIEGRKFSCLTLAQSLVKVNLAIAETEEAREKILVYMEKALEIIDFPDHGDTSQVMTEWFSRVAWNMALRPAIKVRHVFEFFDMCCRFLEKMNGSPTRLKNTLIFTVAAGIQTLREESEGDDEERHNTAKRILAAIGKCRDLEKDNYDIISLLYIYEFETRIIMEDSLMEEILKKMLQAPFVDEKALQTVASIAYEQSSKHYRLITLALEGSINRIAEKSFGDYGQLIQLQHSILQVLFYVQEYITSSVEEETLHKCKNIYKMIKEDDDFQEYPKTKILWLMTKCWNWGVNMLAAGNTAMSYEWCTMAMKFLDELKDLKYLHEEKLQALYSSYFGSQTV
ncbi:hypothetical protein CEXT_153091 [Caerostris extrusa]|uniref:Uncharacterized protein n=1 Tax=Caerostris extrusa TaxID=172846 RepID=A0AAV4Q2W7_CAEEX|nr:hypothetical protein CEXT_153091 [Caerostris extrusa]